jgi:FkbM family methyltransferase
MFNNSNPKTNGEHHFFNSIKNHINVIFDVGCRSDSEFINFIGEVHYFDPVNEFIENLKSRKNTNKSCFFNSFGLGDENKEIYYYPRYQSFYNRINSCHISDDVNKKLLHIKRGDEYVASKNLTKIDFLKIDTEGFELHVLKGFDGFLQNVNIIQFEYGGTFLDNKIKLVDVKNYLEQKGFYKFSYLTNTGPKLITDFNDHYQYCNIVCLNKKSTFVPF